MTSSSAASTFFFDDAGSTHRATTSVRLWVPPPARKKRRGAWPPTPPPSPPARVGAGDGADDHPLVALGEVGGRRRRVVPDDRNRLGPCHPLAPDGHVQSDQALA